MSYIYKVASLNINAIANCTRLRVLVDFLWKLKIDIILLQEATSTNIDAIR
jgi:exonuclease III